MSVVREFAAVDPVIDDQYSERTVFPRAYPARVLVHTRPGNVHSHWHSGMEVLYTLEGLNTVMIGATLHALEPGSIAIVSPNALHQATATADDAGRLRVLSVTFDGSRIARVLPEAEQYSLSWEHGSDQARERMVTVMDRLHEIVTRWDGLRNLQVNAALFNILDLAYREFSEGPAASGGSQWQDGVVGAVLGFLQDSYQQPVTVGAVASMFGYSREHLSRLFKASVGVSIKQYLTSLRFSAAYDLWMSGRLTLIQTAQAAGFPNAAALSREFERRLGLSPVAFRQRQIEALRQGRAHTA